MEELAGLEGGVVQRLAGGTDGHAKGDACVGEPVEHRQARESLAAERGADNRRREAELVDEHLAVQAARRHRAKERPAQEVVVRGAIAAEDLRQRRRRSIELHGDHASPCQVHAVRPAAVFDELQRPCRAVTTQRAEKVAERGGSKASGQLHSPHCAVTGPRRPTSRRT